MQIDKNYAVIKLWLKEVIDYEEGNLVFITIRYNNPIKSKQYLIDEARLFLSKVNRRLLGRHWIKNLFKFIMVIERGKYNSLHSHIIVNIRDISFNDFFDLIKKLENLIKYDVISNFLTQTRVRACNLLVKQVFSDNIIDYLMKEIGQGYGKVNFDNLLPYNVVLQY
ncbi:MAG: hypothetical protein EOM53_02705 [Alphaproteobacteria bacterium]|nr:hypothetical protein [Alphaproteobacteria bacterium]